MKKIFVLVAVVFVGQVVSGFAHAEDYKCNQVVDDLIAYNADTRLNEFAASEFLNRTNVDLLDLYSKVSIYENKSDLILIGTFNMIQDSAAKASDGATKILENSSFFETRMQELIERVRNCIP
jgi:hypothetical protein